MAQLVEQRIRNAWVGGSSPPIGSRQEKRGTFLSFFVYHAEHCKNLARKSILGYLAMYPRINRKVSNDTLQSNLASFFRPFHLCFIFVYRQCLCCIIPSSLAEEIGEDEPFGMSGQCAFLNRVRIGMSQIMQLSPIICQADAPVREFLPEEAVQQEDDFIFDTLTQQPLRSCTDELGLFLSEQSQIHSLPFIPNRSLEKASCQFLMTAIRKTALYMFGL